MSGVYRYYDTPDGQDFFKKQYCLMRRAFPFGAYHAWFDIVAWSKPTGVVPVTVCFFRSISRPIMCVSLFNVTTFMTTRLRGKDDPLNHFLAVFPVAYYIRNWLPTPWAWVFAFPMSLLAFTFKQYKLWFPKHDFYREPSTYRDNRDNTIFADFYSYLWLSIKEKNWVTLEEAIQRGLVQSVEMAKQNKMSNYKDGQARGLVRVGDGSEILQVE